MNYYICLLLIGFFSLTTNNLFATPSESSPSVDSCRQFMRIEFRLHSKIDSIEKINVYDQLIARGSSCPEYFFNFLFERSGTFTEKQDSTIEVQIHDIIRKKGWSKSCISTVGRLGLTEYKYELAKMLDPDFFQEYERYYGNYPHLGVSPDLCLPDESDFRLKSSVIVALINLGDEKLQDQFIHTLGKIQKMLTDRAVKSFENMNKGDGSFAYNVGVATIFYRNLRPLVGDVATFEFMDSIFQFTRYTLTDTFLYTDGRKNRALQGSKIFSDFIYPRLLKRGSFWKVVQQSYYFVCDPAPKDPYLCDEAWNDIKALYEKYRKDPSLWRSWMR